MGFWLCPGGDMLDAYARKLEVDMVYTNYFADS
jgi:hypothetical protein